MKRMQKGFWWISTLLTLGLTAALALADTRSNDAEMRTLGQERLSRAKLSDKVTIQVDNAIAVLSGNVDSVGLKERAGKEVARVRGILGVTNNIGISGAAAGDKELLEKVARSVRSYPYYTIFDNVELAGAAGAITLSGQVAQPWRKDEIGRIVSMVSGVKQVTNNLEILPLSPYDDEVRMRVARAIYRDPSLSRYAIGANPPIHIIVRNGNVTLTGVVQNEADKAIAGRAALFAATYFEFKNQLNVETAMAKLHR